MNDTTTVSTNIGITIPTRLDKATSKENTRYAIAGALITSGGADDVPTVAWATNGRVLAVVGCFDCTGIDQALDVPRGQHLIDAACLPKLKTRRTAVLRVEDGTVTGGRDKHGDHVPTVEGSFPPCLDVLPDLDKLNTDAVVSIPVDRLRELLDAVTSTDSSKDDPQVVSIIPPAPGKGTPPFVIVGDAGIGVSAPMKQDDKHPSPVTVYATRRGNARQSWNASTTD